MSGVDEFRQAVRAAVAATDSPWRLDRANTQHRTTEAVIAATWRQLLNGLELAEATGYRAGRKEATHDAGRAKADGYKAGRTDALHEAATMLKRHGHRTAVDRVQALATPTAAPEPTDHPAGAPRPPHDPQNGTSAPTRNTPQEALQGPPEPRTPTRTAPSPPARPSAAPTGLQAAIDANEAAERENRERDAWIGHAPSGHRRA